jgi:hypothetical protein
MTIEYIPVVEHAGEVQRAGEHEEPHYWGVYRRGADGLAEHLFDVLTEYDAQCAVRELTRVEPSNANV